MSRGNWTRFCGLGLLAATVFALCGCWDRRETSEIAIVGSLGLDEGTEEGKVLVSFEVINADALARGIGQPGAVGKVAGWVLREQATTIFNALRNADRRSPRRLFVGQVNTIIIGQNLARKGIAEYLDFFARQEEFRHGGSSVPDPQRLGGDRGGFGEVRGGQPERVPVEAA